jgi:hypothetical protein
MIAGELSERKGLESLIRTKQNQAWIRYGGIRQANKISHLPEWHKDIDEI